MNLGHTQVYLLFAKTYRRSTATAPFHLWTWKVCLSLGHGYLSSLKQFCIFGSTMDIEVLLSLKNLQIIIALESLKKNLSAGTPHFLCKNVNILNTLFLKALEGICIKSQVHNWALNKERHTAVPYSFVHHTVFVIRSREQRHPLSHAWSRWCRWDYLRSIHYPLRGCCWSTEG